MLTLEATPTETERRLTLVAQIGLLMGPFLSMMDSNIVNVALPKIEHSLNGSLTMAQWVISGYLLALSAVLAASAYLANLRERVWSSLYNAATLIFHRCETLHF